MHLILLHGYLLTGTGSNIYVANVAKAWQKQGHAVTVVCQDPGAGALPFVDEYIGPGDTLPASPPNPGNVRVVVPDIDGLLPVYVFDRYDGYRVKTIPEMSNRECEAHVTMTAAALHKIAEQGAHGVLANHALFGPAIARRALEGTGVPYHVKIHGSALEYTLVPHPELMPYAEEGLKYARRIFVGTRYVKKRVTELFAEKRGELELDAKLSIVPPGMDPEIFKLPDNFESSRDRFLENVGALIRENGNGRRQHRVAPPGAGGSRTYHDTLVLAGESYDQRAVDADLPERWPPVTPVEPVILYFGKFLATKGVGELLLSVPAILEKIPAARFVFVGFGSYREHLEGMIQALSDGNMEMFTACARAGEFVETAYLSTWFRRLEPAETDRITVTGILDHGALGRLLQLASLTIVPSKWPEAFGMVAVEAMAAGVLPLCNDHAGLRDVIEAVGAASPEMADLMRLDRKTFVEQLPDKIQTALSYLYPNGFADRCRRQQVAEQLHRISAEKFSWDGIARRLLP